MKALAKWTRKAGVEFTRVYKDGDGENFNPDLRTKDNLPIYDGNGMFGEHVNDAWGHWDFKKNNPIPGRVSVFQQIKDSIESKPDLNELVYNIGTDPGCVEIPTAPLKSWKKLREFYTQMNKICADHNYVSNNPECVGSGSHIHVEHKGDAKLVAKVARDLYYRPYLTWAFAHPADDENATELNVGPFPNWHQLYYSSNYTLDNGGDAIRIHEETIEFRIFDMTFNWAEQEEHMAYVQRYMQWISSAKYVEPKPLFYSKDNPVTAEQAIKLFKAHIRELGLPWSRYKKYADYITKRFEWKNVKQSKCGADAKRTLSNNAKFYDTAEIKKEVYVDKNFEFE